MLTPHPKLGDIFYQRLKSMNPQELQMLQQSINPHNAGALTKLLPELQGTIQKSAAKTHADRMARMQAQQGPPQQAPGGPNSIIGKFGMSHGGAAMDRTGYVNKGIPMARGGMPMMPHIAPPPHAMNPNMSMPAEMKVNSRKYNTPTFAHGGLVNSYFGGGGVGSDPGGMPTCNHGVYPGGNYAAGGMPQHKKPAQQVPGQYPGPAMQEPMAMGLAVGGPGGMMANPEIQQKLAMQNQALQAVPSEGKADAVPANLSKGEFVMCSPSVMWFGMQKLAKMQEQAHQGMAEHMAMQQMNQQQAKPQPPGGQQAQAPQRPPMGLAAPPPSMGAAVQNANGAPMPNPTQQRIQATDTPRPKGMGALSPIQ